MELISSDAESITIRLHRGIEWSTLLAVVHSASLEYEALDVNILNRSKEQVEKLEDDLFTVADQSHGFRK